MPPPPPGPFRIVSEDPSGGTHGRRAGIGASSQRQQDEDEQRAWDRASTGKHASSRNTGLLRWTRFVREGEGQRQAQAETSKEVELSAPSSPPPPQAQQPQAPAETQQSMAGLYAQLTANMASASDMTKKVTPSAPLSPAIPATARCPTCSTLLPNPCPSAVLRTHLLSLAHRLSLNQKPARTNSPASSTSGDASAEATTARLHLDAQNSGYVMLHNMGWREGAGLGVEEWEFLQRQQQSEGSGKTSDQPIVIDDEGEDEEQAADIFEADEETTPTAITSTSSPPRSPPPESTTPPTQQPARKARLVPITPAYKNDRKGLGITPAPSHSRKDKHGKRHTSHTSTRKQREQQLRADAHRLQTIRDSLR